MSKVNKILIKLVLVIHSFITKNNNVHWTCKNKKLNFPLKFSKNSFQ